MQLASPWTDIPCLAVRWLQLCRDLAIVSVTTSSHAAATSHLAGNGAEVEEQRRLLERHIRTPVTAVRLERVCPLRAQQMCQLCCTCVFRSHSTFHCRTIWRT